MARVILEPHDVPDKAGALASSGRDWKLAMRLAANRTRVLMASTGLIQPEGADTMNLFSTWAQWLRRNHTVGRASATQQLQALADVLEQAAALAPSAGQTVRACGQAGPVLGTVAQRGGDLISQYDRLGHVLDDIQVDEQHAPLAREIAALLRYHRWLIHASWNWPSRETRPHGSRPCGCGSTDLAPPQDGWTTSASKCPALSRSASQPRRARRWTGRTSTEPGHDRFG